MTSFAITVMVIGQCCRRHVVGKRVVSDISVVHSCWSICSLCSESNNDFLLLRLLTAVLGTSALLRITDLYKYRSVLRIPSITWPTTWRRVREIENLVTSLHFIYTEENILLALW